MRGSNPLWSVLGGSFNERVFGIRLVFCFKVYVSCWLLAKKVFPKKSAMFVYVASYMSHRVLLQPSLDARFVF